MVNLKSPITAAAAADAAVIELPSIGRCKAQLTRSTAAVEAEE